jgi:hypothetical protein
MFIWLASYPKSGNTLVRAMLASYFFSSNGNFNFDLLINIRQFPANHFFKKFGININDDNEILKNYIEVQSRINNKSSVQFLKTHSSFNKFNDYSFTSLDVTLGAIYIIRDPRTLIESFSRHYQCSIEQSLDYILNGLLLKRNEVHPMTIVGSWLENYKSWKSFNFDNRYMLVKYEDLINKKEETFVKILKFIQRLSKSNIPINLKKIENTLVSTEFENMQKLEKKFGFKESPIDVKTGERIVFFEVGPKNNYKKVVDSKIINKIETSFFKELKELGYL